jgi:endonuclease G
MKRLLTLSFIAINLILFSVNLIAEPRSLVDGVIRYEKTSVRYRYGYVGFYDPFRKLPALVYYVLDGDRPNDVSLKRPSFKPDTSVRSAVTADYTNSGFDRGHMAPDADFSVDAEVLALTYFMSNIAPQYHRFNAGVWLRLEDRGRALSKQYGKVLIVSGVIYDNIGDNVIRGSKNQITIPQAFYKIFVYIVNDEMVFEGYIVPHLDETVRTYDQYFALPEEIEAQGYMRLEDLRSLF